MKKETLTSGNVFKSLLLFSLPMILSVTLQQFYNICDSMIAGRMISDNALSAVSATYPITVIYLAIATGFSVGVNVITARFVGEKNNKSAKTSIYVSLITITVMAITLTILGIALLKPILKLLNVSGQPYYNDALTYLLYYTLGIVFLFLYNTTTSLFQSLGNSRIPLYLLIVTISLNLVLDIVFVKKGMDIFGIALATFISQGISMFASLTILLIYKEKLLNDKAKVFDLNIFKDITSIAIPAIIQGMVISISGVLIQSLINSFGPSVTAGYGASYKVIYIVINIYNVMSNAITTFTSANAGAKKYDRIVKGFISGFGISLIITLVATIVLLTIPEQLLSIFKNENTSQEVITVGKRFIYSTAPFYIFMAIKIPCEGVLKGAKDMRSFIISTSADLLIRVGLAYLFAYTLNDDLKIIGIFLSWPIGWFVGMVVSIIFYRIGRWKSLIEYKQG